MARRRVDTLLAERGLAPSRSSAAGAVRAGLVRFGSRGPRAEKPGQLVRDDVELVVDEGRRYVSRGGIKLDNALRQLDLPVAGRSCLDVGASTGGFTDCLLQHGASRVVALDVAYGVLDWSLRRDPSVHVIERKNARHLRPQDLPYAPGLVTLDVSFISLTKLLPAVVPCLASNGELLALVKPQFELERRRVGRQGVVRDAVARRDALLSVTGAARALGLRVLGYAPSGLPGPKGNRETFLHCGLEGEEIDDVQNAVREVEPDVAQQQPATGDVRR